MKLRALVDWDVILVERWLSQPHVEKWYTPKSAWMEELILRDSKYEFLHHFMVEEAGRDIGFCQYYEYPKGGESWHGTQKAAGSYSIDYLIGEPDCLSKGYGTELVRLLTETVCFQPGAERILVKPEKDNERSRKTLLSAGYEYDRENDMFFFEPPVKTEIVKLSQRPEFLEKAADWFSSKWSVPREAYVGSIRDSFTAKVPSWYLCMRGDAILAGMGVIENDFHPRKDLTPNVCAVFTEPEYRGRGIARAVLDYVCRDMKQNGFDTLYLLTDHTGLYERYGWMFYEAVTADGEETPSRMYIHYEGERQ